jgi:hypothetical protein
MVFLQYAFLLWAEVAEVAAASVAHFSVRVAVAVK